MENDKQTLKVEEAELPGGWPCIMVDLETLGTSDKASILEIGARCFCLDRGLVGPGFHVKIALVSNVVDGREIDAKTLLWWMDQWRKHGEVPELERGRVGLQQALDEFESWWRKHEGHDTVFWSRGSFDERILGHALKDFRDTEELWKFWQVMDQRSVLNWEGVKAGKADHDALADATLQVDNLLLAQRLRQQGMALEPREEGIAQALPEPDLAAGWEAYRRQILETHGALLMPAWTSMTSEQREAFACGVRACYEPTGEGSNRRDAEVAEENAEVPKQFLGFCPNCTALMERIGRHPIPYCPNCKQCREPIDPEGKIDREGVIVDWDAYRKLMAEDAGQRPALPAKMTARGSRAAEPVWAWAERNMRPCAESFATGGILDRARARVVERLKVAGCRRCGDLGAIWDRLHGAWERCPHACKTSEHVVLPEPRKVVAIAKFADGTRKEYHREPEADPSAPRAEKLFRCHCGELSTFYSNGTVHAGCDHIVYAGGAR